MLIRRAIAAVTVIATVVGAVTLTQSAANAISLKEVTKKIGGAVTTSLKFSWKVITLPAEYCKELNHRIQEEIYHEHKNRISDRRQRPIEC